MSGVELKPINEAGGTNILLPLGKTNLGRGSFFEIADKRVSRNHALLEVDDGKIRVMPIHTNPTFFHGAGGTKMAPLTKDVWQDLKNGDRVALTPDEHIFEVIIDDRPIVQETQSPRLCVGGVSPIKQTSPLKQATDSPSHQNNGVHDAKKENCQNAKSKEDDDGGLKEKREPSPATTTECDDESTTDSKKATEEGDKYSSKVEETEKEEEQDEDEDGDSPTKGPGTVVYDDKEKALPVQKERTLPSWMSSPPKAGAAAPAKRAKAETPAKKASKNEDAATPQKRGRGRPKVGTKATPQPEKMPQAKAKARKYDDGDDDDYLSEDDEPAPKKSKTSRSQRGSAQVASYAEDGYDILDEEWIASDVDDDGSDWEMDSQSQSHKKGKGKGKSPKGKFVSPRQRGRRKKYAQSSEEEEWSEEEAYVPRPSKRRASSSSNSQPTGQGKRASRKARQDSDFSEDDDEYVPKPTKRTPVKAKKDSGANKKDSGENKKDSGENKKDPGANKKGHAVSGDEEEEEEEEVEAPKKKPEKSKKLKSCSFGKRCYRKNAAHFGEFCHPGDPDYRSISDEDEEDEEDDDRPECEYGTACYRKSEEHNAQNKHTKAPPRPKREAAQKVLKTTGFSDDEDEPNTYDYNDSFLNEDDDVSDSASVPNKHSEDSDWGPENSQDVRDLKKEAKDFIGNKKMHKT